MQYLRLLFLVALLFFISSVHSEGWKELRPGNTESGKIYWHKIAWGSPHPSVLDEARVHFKIANPGEKAYFGFNWIPYDYIGIVRIKDLTGTVIQVDTIHEETSPGWIFDYTQASAGPDVVSPAGYDALEFTPPAPGDYMFDIGFTDPLISGTRMNFDMTIVDTTQVPAVAIPGRVYCQSWSLDCQTNPGLQSTLYGLPDDSIVTSIFFNGYMGIDITINLNENGVYPPPMPWIQSRKSVVSGAPWLNPQYKMFLNNPDSLVYPTGILGQVLPGTLTATPHCTGITDISFVANKTASAEIRIQVDPAPGLQLVDVVMSVPVVSGLNTIQWDGLDGLGLPVANGSPVLIEVIYMNGLMNLPIEMPGTCLQGLVVQLHRPAGPIPLLYWDDRNIDPLLYNLTGCLSIPPNQGCHILSGSPYSWLNTVNTWWYTTAGIVSASSILHRAFSDTTDTLVCASVPVVWRGQTYTTAGTFTQNYPSVLTGCDSTYVLNLIHLPSPLVDLGNDTTACTGQNVTFDAGACSGCTYIWANLTLGLPNIGTGQTYTATQTGEYRVIVTGANGCTDRDSVNFAIGDPVTVDITISAPQTDICAGTPVTFSSLAVNPGTSPSYQWKVNGTAQGTNSPAFTYTPANSDVVTCILTSSDTVCISNNPDTSNAITMTVSPLVPVSVTVAPSQNPVCAGTSVTFSALPVPSSGAIGYQWAVNGVPAGADQPIYTYIPSDNDVVTCTVTVSGIPCLTGNPSVSQPVIMTVDPNLIVDVLITASANPVCSGLTSTFTAVPANGGMPVYQWMVNGVNAGMNLSNYTYTPVHGDIITCILSSSLSCTMNNPATSNAISMNVPASPVVDLITCMDSVTTTNAKPFRLGGGTPNGGTWSGPGVNSITGIFTPSLAGTGNKTISYTYTNAASCTVGKAKTIIVQAPAAFICGNDLTDIRDNKTYPTVQIGAQCWLARDLDYGIQTAQTDHQRDNCIAEKFTNTVLPSGDHPKYQWDEMMNYEDLPGVQGLCPPGWHIPSENEWNILFTNYTNNAFAGAPLKFSGFSGFYALLSGVSHQNNGWDYTGIANFFWSSTTNGSFKAWSHGMNTYDPAVSIYSSSRQNAFSVRCLRD